MLQARYPKEVVLTDHTEVTLRPLKEKDQEDLVRFYEDVPRKERWFFKEDPCDPLVIPKWIEAVQTKRALGVVAVHEDRIVAHASLLCRGYGGRRHVGRLRISVSPDFRGKRLGTWMVFDLIRRSMELGLDKIQADFIVGVEDRAIEALERLDFVKQGRIRDYVKDEDGADHDCQIMIKHLHTEWSDF